MLIHAAGQIHNALQSMDVDVDLNLRRVVPLQTEQRVHLRMPIILRLLSSAPKHAPFYSGHFKTGLSPADPAQRYVPLCCQKGVRCAYDDLGASGRLVPLFGFW